MYICNVKYKCGQMENKYIYYILKADGQVTRQNNYYININLYLYIKVINIGETVHLYLRDYYYFLYKLVILFDFDN